MWENYEGDLFLDGANQRAELPQISLVRVVG